MVVKTCGRAPRRAHRRQTCDYGMEQYIAGAGGGARGGIRGGIVAAALFPGGVLASRLPVQAAAVS